MTEQELANVIWDIKEIIRNLYDDAEVEDVILPFTLLRRLDCVLDEHRDAIMKEMNAIKDKPALMQDIKLKSLLKQHKLTFFNKSGLSLERLLGAPDQIGASFQAYLDGFTDNVKDILANFVHTDTLSETLDLSPIYSRLERHDKLYSIIQLFVKRADLHPNVVSNSMMGTVFEIVVRRSKESSNTKAGQFYTPREIVRLLVSLTMCGKESELYEPGRAFSIYDPCCGTGGMLTAGREYLQELSGRKDLKVYLYGQELNEKTYAICKSDLLMKGEDQNLDRQLFRGDTLGDDKLEGSTFNFMLANPPFGMDWGKDERVKKRVMDDNCPGGRFEAGLPSSKDGSLLFLQHMISKMDNQKGSRIGIVLNGSPLFNGEAGSGWSNIRKMLLDRNLLDCIVALPKNLFYGTDITTYLWIIDNKVKSVMESFLSDVTFYSSVHYKIVEDEVEKNPELDILGVSDKAVYIIEVKAHELSYKDRVRLDGAKYKFKASVAEACKQCCRSVDFINNSTEPIFGTQQGAVLINKTKPIYKIAVTFQHYSSLLGQMDKLVAASLMEERFRDTWVVSLFDLMVVADFVESEDEFLSYLDMRKIINTNHSTFHDELDLLGQFLNENLADKVIANKPMMIIGGSSDIDEEYAKDFYLPINLSSEKE